MALNSATSPPHELTNTNVLGSGTIGGLGVATPIQDGDPLLSGGHGDPIEGVVTPPIS